MDLLLLCTGLWNFFSSWPVPKTKASLCVLHSFHWCPNESLKGLCQGVRPVHGGDRDGKIFVPAQTSYGYGKGGCQPIRNTTGVIPAQLCDDYGLMLAKSCDEYVGMMILYLQ